MDFEYEGESGERMRNRNVEGKGGEWKRQLKVGQMGYEEEKSGGKVNGDNQKEQWIGKVISRQEDCREGAMGKGSGWLEEEGKSKEEGEKEELKRKMVQRKWGKGKGGEEIMGGGGCRKRAERICREKYQKGQIRQ